MRAASTARIASIRRDPDDNRGHAFVTAVRSASSTGCGSSPDRTRSTDPVRHPSAPSSVDSVAGSYEVFRPCSMESTVVLDKPLDAANAARLRCPWRNRASVTKCPRRSHRSATGVSVAVAEGHGRSYPPHVHNHERRIVHDQPRGRHSFIPSRSTVHGMDVMDSTGTEGMIVGVTGRLTVGTLVGSLVGVRVGNGTGSFVLVGLVLGVLVVTAGGLILIGSRGGEVPRGVKAVDGFTDGLTVGLFVGCTCGGGCVITCLGGSAPGSPGSSAMTAPPTVIPVATSATAIRL